MKSDPKKVSPIRGKLQRQPGQYLSEKIFDFIFGYVMVLSAAVISFALAVEDWISGYVGDIAGQRFASTFLAFVFGAFALWKLPRMYRKIQNYRLGEEGEIYVSQILEGLRASGYVSVHDIPAEFKGTKFNIDHVLVGPKGVFVVETKTWRKRVRIDEKISYSNGAIFAGQQKHNHHPISQARFNALWMEDLLARRLSEDVSVRAVLVFPGWYVDASATADVKEKHGVLMLNPKAIMGFLEVYPDVIDVDLQGRISSTLSAYVREKIEQDEQWG